MTDFAKHPHDLAKSVTGLTNCTDDFSKSMSVFKNHVPNFKKHLHDLVKGINDLINQLNDSSNLPHDFAKSTQALQKHSTDLRNRLHDLLKSMYVFANRITKNIRAVFYRNKSPPRRKNVNFISYNLIIINYKKPKNMSNPKAALNMPNKIGDKIIRAQSIQTKLTGNANFPVGSWPANIVSLTQFGTDVTTLVTTETAVVNKTGTVAARNAALTVVLTDLRALKTMVQVKADANPANAANIIISAGFIVVTRSNHSKRQNQALNTEVLGTVLLTADKGGHHEWQMSKDGGTTIVNLPATTTSITKVTGLNPGDVWYFRNRKVNTKKTTYNWSTWLKLIIGPGGKTTGGGNQSGVAGSLPNTL